VYRNYHDYLIKTTTIGHRIGFDQSPCGLNTLPQIDLHNPDTVLRYLVKSQFFQTKYPTTTQKKAFLGEYYDHIMDTITNIDESDQNRAEPTNIPMITPSDNHPIISFTPNPNHVIESLRGGRTDLMKIPLANRVFFFISLAGFDEVSGNLTRWNQLLTQHQAHFSTVFTGMSRCMGQWEWEIMNAHCQFFLKQLKVRKEMEWDQMDEEGRQKLKSKKCFINEDEQLQHLYLITELPQWVPDQRYSKFLAQRQVIEQKIRTRTLNDDSSEKEFLDFQQQYNRQNEHISISNFNSLFSPDGTVNHTKNPYIKPHTINTDTNGQEAVLVFTHVDILYEKVMKGAKVPNCSEQYNFELARDTLIDEAVGLYKQMNPQSNITPHTIIINALDRDAVLKEFGLFFGNFES
jgi:hypothetical protein